MLLRGYSDWFVGCCYVDPGVFLVVCRACYVVAMVFWWFVRHSYIVAGLLWVVSNVLLCG